MAGIPPLRPVADAAPPKVSGCSCDPCCGLFRLAFVQRRFLVVSGSIVQGVIELPIYLLWCGLWLAVFFIGWVSFKTMTPNPFEPGGVMFDLFFMVAIPYILGNALSTVVRLPPLFGYMIVGMLWRNWPLGDPSTGIPEGLITITKEVALTIIVSRAGLGLPVLQFLGEPAEQRRNGWPPENLGFKAAQVGMPVLVNMQEKHPIEQGPPVKWAGEIDQKDGGGVAIKWRPPADGGPPPNAPESKAGGTSITKENWWRVESHRKGACGDMSRPEWQTLSVCQRLTSTVAKVKNGLMLAATPMGFEALFYVVSGMLIFKFSVIWGFLLGFVMAAVSPAVVVPGMLDLQKRGFIGKSGPGTSPVPALVVFASGLDDVLAITFFGVFFGIAFSGADPTPQIIKAPCEIFGGVLVGGVLGTLLFYLSLLVEEKEAKATPQSPLLHVQDQEKKDMKRFGVAHRKNPHPKRKEAFTGMRLPMAERANELISLLAFCVCVALVLGLSITEVGSAGTLTSTGVLGAMFTCLTLNYHFSKSAYQAKFLVNEANLLRGVSAREALTRDKQTLDFFNMQGNGPLAFSQKADECDDEADLLRAAAARHEDAFKSVEYAFKRIWDLAACPLLFALVGRSILYADLFDPNVLPKALGCLMICLGARCLGAIVACTGSGWTFKNKLFVALAWLPKATVQAAVGGMAFTIAEEQCSICGPGCGPADGSGSGNSTGSGSGGAASARGVALAAAGRAFHILGGGGGGAGPLDPEHCGAKYKEQYEWGKIVLQVSVVGIIISAPIGAAAIALLGPHWLEKAPTPDDPDDISDAEEEDPVNAQTLRQDGMQAMGSAAVAVKVPSAINMRNRQLSSNRDLRRTGSNTSVHGGDTTPGRRARGQSRFEAANAYDAAIRADGEGTEAARPAKKLSQVHQQSLEDENQRLRAQLAQIQAAQGADTRRDSQVSIEMEGGRDPSPVAGAYADQPGSPENLILHDKVAAV